MTVINSILAARAKFYYATGVKPNLVFMNSTAYKAFLVEHNSHLPLPPDSSMPLPIFGMEIRRSHDLQENEVIATFTGN